MIYEQVVEYAIKQVKDAAAVYVGDLSCSAVLRACLSQVGVKPEAIKEFIVTLALSLYHDFANYTNIIQIIKTIAITWFARINPWIYWPMYALLKLLGLGTLLNTAKQQ